MHLGGQISQHLFGHGGNHRRGNEARGYGIDTHAFGAHLARPGLGKADHAKFGGGVVGLAKIAIQTDDRAGVQDHTAALGHHAISHGLRAVENTAQVDVNDLVKLLNGHFLQAGVLGDAGVVDQHINAAKLGLDLGHHIVNHGALCHVHDKALDRGARGAALGHRLVHTRLLDVTNDDDGAFGCKFDGGRQANALCCASDDGNLVGKTCCHGNPRSW